MERGHIVLEHTNVEEEEELWQDDEGDHDGWFCVRTDPFPCPANGCTFVAEFMTAAHLILVWQELDDPNLLRHAARARDVGRNPRVTGYRSEYGPSASYYAWIAAGRPVHGVKARVIPETFGESAPFSLGVEEELMILDAATHEQVAAVDRILRGVEGLDLPGRLKTELFASVFEINTDVCASVADVDAALPVLRRAAAQAAEREGLAIAGAGTHPFARPEAQPIVKEERYVTFVGYGGISVRRQGVQGLHVHVGMPSAEDCWRCLDAILPWLPVVLALSANSPWFAGELTGMASNRAPILAELPRGGAPPGFTSYAEWEAWVERLVAIGVLEDYTRIWWDVRPHPKLGTLEVRVPDQPTDVRLSAAFAALIQAMCATALAEGLPGGSPRADYVQNRWAAARFGPRANLIHPDGLSFQTATELALELFERVRPAAVRLDSAGLLARLDPSRCEADEQLSPPAPRDVAAALVRRSLA